MSIIKPEDVSREETIQILEVLNTVKTAKELAEIIEIPDHPDIGIKLAEDILEFRNNKGLFTNLRTLHSVPNIGPKRFTIIIGSLINYTLPYEHLPTTDILTSTNKSMAPILRYDIPSPSSYEGRNYIELKNLQFNGKNLPFNNYANDEPTPEQFIEANRDSIFEYLKNTSKEEFERIIYLVFDLDEIELSKTVIQYPGTYTFEKDIIGLEPKGWVEKGKLDGLSHQIVSEKAGHKNVLQVRDEGTGDLQYYATFEKQQKGTIEFWTFQDTDTWIYINIEEDFQNGISLNLGRTNYYYTNRDRVNIHIQGGLASNLWHHHKIIFDVTAKDGKGVFDWYIDNVQNKGSNLIFMNSLTGVNRFEIGSTSGAKTIVAYIDAIGFSWDPKYSVGDNLARKEIEIRKQEIFSPSQQVDQQIIDMIKDLDSSFGAKYRIFKYLIQNAMTAEKNRRMPIFYRSMGGNLNLKFIKIPIYAEPRLILVETYKLTSFPGDYGAGTTIKTFSLLPKEETEISIKTWKKSIKTTKEASSILDSYTEEKADEFETSVQNENSSTSRVEESTSYHAEASAGGSWGGFSINVSGGVEGSSNSSREEFSKNVMNSASKQSQTASSKREVNIETSFESTEETGEEVTIMRKIENLNASRTLNFTFRQMNQQYHSLLHLIDVRIAFYNGYPGSMKEYALFELDDLVNDFLTPTNISDLEHNVLTPEEVTVYLRNYLLAEYTNVFDYHGNLKELLEEVTFEGSSSNSFKYLRVIPATERRIEEKGKKLKVKVGQQDYIIREETRDENGRVLQPEDVRFVDGIIIGKKVLTMRTDGVIVESLLGEADALDDYALESRKEILKEDRLKNSLKNSEISKIEVGVEIIRNLIENNKIEKATEAYREIFGVQEGIKYFSEIFQKPHLNVEEK